MAINKKKLQQLIKRAHSLRTQYENALGDIEKYIGVDVDNLGELVGDLDADDLLVMVDKAC